jgi:hypothetical protein
MKVTHTEGRAAQDARLHRREMRLLKCVMRDRTNPQYRAKLSLNPLMIAVFSLVRRTVCYKPLWPGGGGGNGEGERALSWGVELVRVLSWRLRSGANLVPPALGPALVG